jgi:hypothetical protein
MTPANALQWLAKLEKDCDCWHVIDRNEGRTATIRKAPDLSCSNCGGTGKAPVLPGLREPCPNFEATKKYTIGSGWTWETCQDREAYCLAGKDECHGQGWTLIQDRQAIQDAMVNDGWDMEIHVTDHKRLVMFYRFDPYRPSEKAGGHEYIGDDADDHLAAVKALKRAGYA